MDKKEYNRKWREAHKEHIREYNISYNKSHPEQIRGYKLGQQRDLEKRREYREKSNRKLREDILTHYGDGKLACVICGENKLPCLTIDHINGGGNKHRKTLGLRAGMQFYRWLRKQGYPLGFRTLCRNCQCLT